MGMKFVLTGADAVLRRDAAVLQPSINARVTRQSFTCRGAAEAISGPKSCRWNAALLPLCRPAAAVPSCCRSSAV